MINSAAGACIKPVPEKPAAVNSPGFFLLSLAGNLLCLDTGRPKVQSCFGKACIFNKLVKGNFLGKIVRNK